LNPARHTLWTEEMNKKLLALALLLAALQTSCKVVNTHTFKVTGAAEINGMEARIATTKGTLLLSTLTEKQIDILKSLRPFQCLSVRTSEAFDMIDRSVRFRNFKLTKLIEADAECRKIKVTPRITIQ
jgi:ribosomal protein L7/L12